MKSILCAVMFLLSVPAAPAADPVARIEVAGAIDPVTAEFVVRGIERAESEGAALVLLRLDTPGGFGASMEAIIARMLRSRVPVVVWVGPGGAKAASAGFFVLLAADVAAHGARGARPGPPTRSWPSEASRSTAGRRGRRCPTRSPATPPPTCAAS
jgi:membrane-bound serine protease (ClpP class)